MGTAHRQALDDVLRAADDVCDVDDLGPALLEPLRRLVAADSLAYNEQDLPDRIVWITDPPEVAVEADSDAFLRYAHQHPIANHFVWTRDGGPVSIADFLTVRQFCATDVYDAFYKPLSTRHQLAVGCANGRIAITWQRWSHPFDESDRERLALLRAPLELAYVQVRARTAARRVLAGEALPGKSVVFLDELPGELRPWVEAGPRAPYRDGSLVAHYLRAGTATDSAVVLIERPPLSPREQEVFELLCQGLTAKEIGAELSISPRTVQHHLERMYARLGVRNAAAAVAAVLTADRA